MQAVILAGGKGTQLGALAAGPKPLVDIGGKPFVRYLIENLRRFGCNEIVLLVGPYARDYERSLGNGGSAGVRLVLVVEDVPAGTAGALVHAAPRLASEFLLLNGDSFFDINLLDLAARAQDSGAPAVLALAQVDDAGRYGATTLKGDVVTAFAEKASIGPGLINAGIYWLKRDVLDRIGAPPVSLERDLLPRLIAEGAARGFAYRGRFIDIGMPEDLTRARQLMPRWERRPAAFLDRDGVLNRDAGYVWRTADFEWLPGAKQAIKSLNDAGYLVIVVTNQSGIARGLYGEADVEHLHRWMNGELGRDGAHIDAFYYCPHHPTEGHGPHRRVCDCRKPAPGLLLRAMHDWRIERATSFMIGDKDIDIAAAHAAGVRGIPSAGPLDILVQRLLAEVR